MAASLGGHDEEESCLVTFPSPLEGEGGLVCTYETGECPERGRTGAQEIFSDPKSFTILLQGGWRARAGDLMKIKTESRYQFAAHSGA